MRIEGVMMTFAEDPDLDKEQIRRFQSLCDGFEQEKIALGRKHTASSFGLFQLHEGGMLTASGLTKEQAFDPRANATVSLTSLRHEWDKGHATRTPGQIAAASQRPADPVGYAAKVDSAMDRARALLAG